MKDLTIIFLTTNKVPDLWAKYHHRVLLEAANGYPLITISRKPMELGTNLIQTGPSSTTNLYRQLLRGAKMAKTTFIALVEDDTLYTKDHFDSFRPPLDTFAYNMNRWSVFTWGEPTFSWKDNRVGAAMIAPRELAIKTLEERFQKYPDLLPETLLHGELGTGGEKEIGITPQKSMIFYSFNPIIQFNHDYFSTVENTEENVKRRHRKRMGFVRAFDVPYWGKAIELVKKFQ